MQEDRPQSHEEATHRPGHDDELASRLDRLSREDAERVLERAIRIHSQRHASETFTSEQVREIAAELGLDESVVDRAIREETSRIPEADEGRGWLIPSRLIERTLVDGSAEEVEERIMSWMETEEGLRPVARTARGVRWEPDKHWLTSTRMAFGTEGTKALRGMPQVVHHQTPLGPNEHLIELDVDAGRIRKTAWGVGTGVSAVSVASGVSVAAALGGWPDLVQFAVVAGPGLMAAAVSTVTIAKGWGASVRKGMSRALDGISHPELYQRTRRWKSRRPRRRDDRKAKGGIQRLVEDVVDAIGDQFR